MKASELIKKMAERLNLADLKIESPGACQVIFDGQPIDFETLSGEELYLIAELGSIPQSQTKECFYTLLKANMCGQGNNNTTFSIDPDRYAIMMHKLIDISNMDYWAFAKHLDEFYLTMLDWKQKLAA